MDSSDCALLLLPVPDLLECRSHEGKGLNLLGNILQQLRPTSSKFVGRVDVAIVLGQLDDTLRISRSRLFGYLQPLLEEAYTCICVAATRSSIDLDLPGGIDARVLFIYPREGQAKEQDAALNQLSGPLIDLTTFVTADRRYSSGIFLPASEHGQIARTALEKCCEENRRPPPKVMMLTEAVLDTTKTLNTDETHEQLDSQNTHFRVAVGGTFDHIHIGHKLLLTTTVYTCSPISESAVESPVREITVGITSSALLVNKKHSSVLESWETRQQRCADFIESILVFHPDPSSLRSIDSINEPGPNGKVVRVTYNTSSAQSVTLNYTDISDPFGPTITDESITALVISAETRAGGKAVNDKRKEKGWKELDIIEVGVLDATSSSVSDDAQRKGFENKISSTEIRRRLLEKESN